MKNKNIVSLIVGIALISGCAPKIQLVKDGVSQEQLGKDNGECRLEAQKATQFDLSGSMFTQQAKQNQANINCLQSKGYAYQQESNEQQKEIDSRYIQAAKKWEVKMIPISEYIVNTCRPKEDKEYIKCTLEKKDESIAASIFPDITANKYNLLSESQQQLIRKEITRKEYRETADKLSQDEAKQIHDRSINDIKSGIYTGKY